MQKDLKTYQERHLGIGAAEREEMLQQIGVNTMDELIDRKSVV